MSEQTIRIGIVTISDRASRGQYEDRGGPAIRECLTEILSCPWEAVARLIPDDRPVIESTLKELCDAEKCCLVVTTGGTGPAKRDVTPEATETVCDKVLDGFGELLFRMQPRSEQLRQLYLRADATPEGEGVPGQPPPEARPKRGLVRLPKAVEG